MLYILSVDRRVFNAFLIHVENNFYILGIRFFILELFFYFIIGYLYYK